VVKAASTSTASGQGPSSATSWASGLESTSGAALRSTSGPNRAGISLKRHLSERPEWDRACVADEQFIGQAMGRPLDAPHEAFADFAANAWLDAPGSPRVEQSPDRLCTSWVFSSQKQILSLQEADETSSFMSARPEATETDVIRSSLGVATTSLPTQHTVRRATYRTREAGRQRN